MLIYKDKLCSMEWILKICCFTLGQALSEDATDTDPHFVHAHPYTYALRTWVALISNPRGSNLPSPSASASSLAISLTASSSLSDRQSFAIRSSPTSSPTPFTCSTTYSVRSSSMSTTFPQGPPPPHRPNFTPCTLSTYLAIEKSVIRSYITGYNISLIHSR